MKDTQKLNLLLNALKEEAEKKTVYDDETAAWPYNPADNGNYDDAFADGEDYGRVSFARELLNLLAEADKDDEPSPAQWKGGLSGQENRWFDTLQGG